MAKKRDPATTQLIEQAANSLGQGTAIHERKMLREREMFMSPGIPALVGSILLFLIAVACVPGTAVMPPLIVIAILGIPASICGFKGLLIVNPNEAKVVQLFGKYIGTVREPGFFWGNPFYTKTAISQRVRNFESGQLKVNDHDGNPVEIKAVVVWRVVDTAEAMFEVQNFENYLAVQAESALRNLATQYPYDSHQDGQLSLRGATAEIAEQLKQEIQARLTQAGMQVMEARISHLAYAPEIAMSMLRRQQASAVIAARQKIVEGAVSMVEMALNLLSKNNIVELDEERKAAMVCNLLVVLCGEHDVQPVVNAGTLHH